MHQYHRLAFISAIVSITVLICFQITTTNKLKSSRPPKNLPSSANSRYSSVALSRQSGEWIGNIWVPPPGWKLYNSSELLSFYKSKSVLFLGDSISRRTSTVLYSILDESSKYKNKTDQPTLNLRTHTINAGIDINRRSVTEKCYKPKLNSSQYNILCRDMPASRDGNDFLIIRVNCTGHVNNFLDNELNYANITGAANLDAIVIGVGMHNAKGVCGSEGNGVDSTLPRVWDKLYDFAEKNRDINIIWTTSGWFYEEDPPTSSAFHSVKDTNKYVFDQMLNQMSRSSQLDNLGVVDWGGAVLQRSFGEDRMRGDIKAHYDLTPRIVLIQMITNKLREMTNA